MCPVLIAFGLIIVIGMLLPIGLGIGAIIRWVQRGRRRHGPMRLWRGAQEPPSEKDESLCFMPRHDAKGN